MADAKRQDARLKRLYGISLKQYKWMLKMQGGKCALCFRVPKSTLHVDHDHKTLRVRGLLCYYCNRRVIGRHRDGDLLERAAAYLRSTFDGRAVDVRETSYPGVRRTSTTRDAQSAPSD